MFRNSYLASMPTYKIILGLGLCTLGGAMLYSYFKNHDDEEEEESKGSSEAARNLPNGIQKPVLQEKITVKMTISNEHIPLIVGRNGKNLTLIEERTHTKIKFCEKDEAHQYCDIKGFPDNVTLAHSLILKEIERSPNIKEEIYVPASVYSQIIGRCGEVMQEICRISLAKVSVDSPGQHDTMEKRRIFITGNQQQVNIARKLLEDKIQADENVRLAVEELEHNREPRRSPTNSLSSSMYSSQTSLNSTSHLPPREKLLSAVNGEKAMEVYVSACASPSKFWLQLIGPQTKRLDELLEAMTDYYNIAENRESHQIAEPYLGQIVATIFKNDGKWYRAEIVSILPNKFNPEEIILDLFFVDYGDSEYMHAHEVFSLRTDFLVLRFQAVECFLANIKPAVENDTGSWDAQSIHRFEELIQVGSWKRLISRVVTYKERIDSNTSGKSYGAREGSPVPGVVLYDPVGDVEVNIGDVLISQGLALPADEYRPNSPSLEAKSSNTSNLSSESFPEMCPSSSKSAVSVEFAEKTLTEQKLNHSQPNNLTEPFAAQYLDSKAGGDGVALLFNGNATKMAQSTINDINTKPDR